MAKEGFEYVDSIINFTSEFDANEELELNNAPLLGYGVTVDEARAHLSRALVIANPPPTPSTAYLAALEGAENSADPESVTEPGGCLGQVNEQLSETLGEPSLIAYLDAWTLIEPQLDSVPEYADLNFAWRECMQQRGIESSDSPLDQVPEMANEVIPRLMELYPTPAPAKFATSYPSVEDALAFIESNTSWLEVLDYERSIATGDQNCRARFTATIADLVNGEARAQGLPDLFTSNTN